MPSNASNRYEGFTFISRGMDSGSQPVLVPKDGVSFAVNVAFRGGNAHNRPGITWRELSFVDEETQEAFEDGLWQGAGTYVWRGSLTGDKSLLLCSISGRIYSIDPNSLQAVDITIPGDPNPNFPDQVWFEQGEMFTFIQDGTSLPLIFGGASLRRSNPAAGEMPIGTIMCYGQGRMTVVLPDRRSFVAGNLVGSAEGGTPAYNFRDSIISFTENNYLNGGGVFSVPDRINAVRALATIDSALNEGPIQLFVNNGAYSANYPYLREEWFEVNYPLVSGSLLSRGALSQNSTLNINNDIWFRASDGSRSFWVARRDSQTWNNLPVSYEMNRVLDLDSPSLLAYSSAVLFDNRHLMTCSPRIVPERGVVHMGLTALDFEEASTVLQDGVPTYDGLWTGLRILQIITLEVSDNVRCFAFALNGEDKISLYELTVADPFDNYSLPTQQRIEGSVETPSYSWGDVLTGGSLRTYKELRGAEIATSTLNGNVDFSVQWRPDKQPTWQQWHAWQECATQECVGLLCDTPNAPQYRDPRTLPMPSQATCNTVNSDSTGQMTNGYSFQARIQFEGPCQIDLFRMEAETKAPPKLAPVCGDCTPKTLASCGEYLFTYLID